MTTNRRVLLLYIAAVTLVVTALSLLLIFNPAVRRFVLEPLVEGVNAFRYVLGYAPQDLQWLALLGIALIAAASYFVAHLPEEHQTHAVRFRRPFPSDGPIMRLTDLLERSQHSKFRREEIVLELRDLAARSVAYHHGLPVDAAKDLLDEERWIEDASVRSFLAMERHAPSGARQARFLDRVEYALGQIERTYSGGYHGTENRQ